MNPRYLTYLLHFQGQCNLYSVCAPRLHGSLIILSHNCIEARVSDWFPAGRFFDLTYFFQTYTRFSLLSIKPAFWLVAKTQNYLLVCYCPPQTAQQPKSEQNIADYKTYTLKSEPFGAKNVTEIQEIVN